MFISKLFPRPRVRDPTKPPYHVGRNSGPEPDAETQAKVPAYLNSRESVGDVAQSPRTPSTPGSTLNTDSDQVV